MSVLEALGITRFDPEQGRTVVVGSSVLFWVCIVVAFIGLLLIMASDGRSTAGIAMMLAGGSIAAFITWCWP